MATAEEFAKWIVANRDKRGTPEFDTVAKAYRLAQAKTAPPPQVPNEPGTIGERASMGFLGAIGGVAQGVTVGAVQPINQFVTELQANRQKANPPGLDFGDVAEFGGEVAPYIAGGYLMRGAAGGARPIARPFLTEARAGAIAGGGSAALQPVSGIESPSQYGMAKAVQIPTGALGGAALGPLAVRAGESVGNVIRSVIDRVRGNMPAQAANALEQEIRAQVARAGGNVTPQQAEAVANARAAERLGVYQHMTRGQIERDPSLYEQEQVTARLPGGESILTNQNTAQMRLNEHLAGLQRRTAMPLDNETAGARVLAPLQQANERGQKLVGALYDAAEASPGNPQFIGSRGFVDDVNAQLKQQRLDRNIPAGARAILEEASSGKYSVRSASRDLQNLNRMIRENEGKPEGVAAQIIRDRLDRGLGASLTEADTAYRAARGAAAQKFAIEDAIPALAAVKNGTAQPHTFMQRFVTGANASPESVANLMGFLNRADPQAAQQIRGQAVLALREAAGFTEQAGQSKLNPVQLDKAWNSLKQSGKARVLFRPDEIQMLDDIARTARNIGERPPGAVGTGMANTRLVGMFANVLKRIASLPGVSSVADVAATVGGGVINRASARNALNASPRFATPLPRRANSLAAGYVGAAVPFFSE